jgi:Cdc6-like AAA superfamily ATPase
MQCINYNTILNRESVSLSIKNILNQFEKNKHNYSFKRGIYIYGAPGSGKTEFIMNLLKELNYDIIKYDAGDIRNKTIIDTITKNNMSDKSVISLLQKKSKPIAIIMDEIDGMNNGDKGGINSLIKIIRPKKTRKQKLEELSFSPIICISSYHVDKKIKELMKVCNVFELKSPLPNQIHEILTKSMPALDNIVISNMINYLQGDLRKLSSINNIYHKHQNILKNEIIQNIFKPKAYNEDTKDITQKLFNASSPILDHINIMNDTDRTIVGLLWHENIIDIIGKEKKKIIV